MTELYPFQAEDLPFFVENPRSVLWYQPRLGKTVVTCKTLVQALPKETLIVAPKNALFVWRDHIQRIFQEGRPEAYVQVIIVRGDAITRQFLWQSPRAEGYTCVFYIVTWNAYIRDFDLINEFRHPDAVINDEYHKFLKNRKNQGFELMEVTASKSWRYHALSGTPAGKGKPQQFWPVLHICDSSEFKSYWPFVEEYADLTKDLMGHYVIAGVKNGEVFRSMLHQHGRIRLRKQCAPWMPEVQRSLLSFEMTPLQEDLYNSLVGKQFYWVNEEEGQLVVAATSMEKILRARQALVCPQVLGVNDPGGAIVQLADTLEDSDDEMGKHTVIFTPFTQALPYFARYLGSRGFDNVGILQGGMEPEDLHARIDTFQSGKGIILCSTKYAQAFSLAGPEACYHIGYEWDPDDNTQAEDRLVPQQGENPILSQYFTANSTIDDLLCEAVTIKQRNINVMLGS